MNAPDGGKPEASRYYRLSRFFREKLGGPVYKIPLDAGFSCPNRDGSLGRGGCIYCHNPAFSPGGGGFDPPLPVAEQLRGGKKKQARGGARYLAYFQAYTNTYAPVARLKALYDEALRDPEVVGLSVSTRPDCVPDAVLGLLENYARSRHVWVEYGLQSAHDRTLARINRGHTFAQFREAVRRTRGRGIYICAHVILGLPGETEAMMLETMDRLNQCGLDGVKFHHLQVIKGTPLAEAYRAGKASVYESAAAYIPVLCDCLERLDPGITIHRLAASVTDPGLLIAPRWSESAGRLAAAVEAELARRGTRQGYQR
jgi:radical SAM protein (TIGR01212 family)